MWEMCHQASLRLRRSVPQLKSGELAKRVARKAEAKESHEEVEETGTAENVEKFAERTVRVTREYNDECKRLLKLMRVPYIRPSAYRDTCLY